MKAVLAKSLEAKEARLDKTQLSHDSRSQLEY